MSKLTEKATRSLVAVALGVVSGCSFSHPGQSSQSTVPVSPFVVQGGSASPQWVTFAPPQISGNPFAITSGSGGFIWYSEDSGNSVDRLTLNTNHIARFQVPTKNASVGGMALGADKRLWFSENAGRKIGAVGSGGSITEYTLPAGAAPSGLVLGPDGDIWFTDQGNDAIGKIDTSGSPTEYSVPSRNAPIDITVGADGNLWFTEASNLIGRATTSGSITEYPTNAQTETLGIARAGDGNVWFGEVFNHRLGRISPSGAVSEFFIAGKHPEALVRGGSGFDLLVMVDEGLASYNTRSHKFTLIGNAPGFPGVGPVTIGPDGNVWFTQPQHGTISVFVRHVLTVSPSSLSLTVGQSATLTASETGASGPLQAKTSNAAVATVTPAGSDAFTVTAVASGSATIMVSDNRHNVFPVPVTVQ